MGLQSRDDVFHRLDSSTDEDKFLIFLFIVAFIMTYTNVQNVNERSELISIQNIYPSIQFVLFLLHLTFNKKINFCGDKRPGSFLCALCRGTSESPEDFLCPIRDTRGFKSRDKRARGKEVKKIILPFCLSFWVKA